MRFFSTFILTTLFVFTSSAQLNTKYIASNYKDGIVKIILFDAELEKKKPGYGYLSRGSGFFVTEDGYIFTNRHVVESCVTGYLDYDYYDSTGKKRAGFAPYSEKLINNKNFIKAYRSGYPVPLVQVFTGNSENDYKLYNAEVVSIGMGAFDGALLRIVSDEAGRTSGFRFTAIPLGDSDKVTQGEQFCVFGYPAQIKGGADVMLRDLSTLSLGIMSGFDFVFNNDYGYMKTDAEIHPGNSGGPVFNEENKAIGIATSKGVATGIGLVGGVNGMYYIAASDSKTLDKLKAKGLKSPKRAFSINTVTGKKQYMKPLAEINKSAGASSGSSSTVDYSSAKIYFSNVSPKANNNTLPPKSKQYSSFTISRKKGGIVWGFVDCYPGKLRTESVSILVDKKKNGVFKKYKDFKVASQATGDNTYFSFTFTEKGTYRFIAYSKELKRIAANTVTIVYD